MKRKKWVISIILLAATVACYHFAVLWLPGHSVSRVSLIGDQQVQFIENRTDQSIMKLSFHAGSTAYKTGREYNFRGAYSYAPRRQEKILKNDISLTVMFPYETIDKESEQWLNNAISAHVFVALQRAAAVIGNNYYGQEPSKSYPEIFSDFLNQPPPALADLYFTDVDIKKILYAEGEGVNDKDIEKMVVYCQSFLTSSKTLRDHRAGQQLSALNSQFQQKFFLTGQSGNSSSPKIN